MESKDVTLGFLQADWLSDKEKTTWMPQYFFSPENIKKVCKLVRYAETENRWIAEHRLDDLNGNWLNNKFTLRTYWWVLRFIWDQWDDWLEAAAGRLQEREMRMNWADSLHNQNGNKSFLHCLLCISLSAEVDGELLSTQGRLLVRNTRVVKK